MDCSIIIVNYNTSHLIIDLLRTVQMYCSQYSYEILIVDNNSPSDNLSPLQEEFPDAKIIHNPVNEGFGRANNIGIELAKGRYILLLNSDTLLIDNAIDRCLDFMNSDFALKSNIGLMACQLLNEDKSHQPSTFERFNLLHYCITSNTILRRVFHRTVNNKIESRYVGAVSGAFMLFRSEVFDVVKPFDPDIFMYSEETELCRERVSKHFNIYYWPEASIIHLGGGSTNNKMQLQERVSYSLTWYKKSLLYYAIHVLWTIVNSLTDLIAIPFMSYTSKRRTLAILRVTPRLLMHQLFVIPRFRNSWGARKSPLKAIG